MKKPSPIESRISSVVIPILNNMGYDLVLLRVSGGQRSSRLEIMTERQDGRAITLDECAEISKRLSVILEVENLIDSNYNLEVSSPGIERPLLNRRDFERSKGLDAKIECYEAVNGRKRFKGEIISTTDIQVTLRIEGADCEIPYESISSANLIYNDKLVARHKSRL